MQETSCHTTEASRVDSIFSRAFDPSFNDDCLNQLSYHCLNPLSTFTAIAYSDIRNVLTGVLDSPDTLSVIQDYFRKVLLFLLLEYTLTSGDETASVGTRHTSASSRLGSAEARTRKAFATLPKAERVVGTSRVSVRTAASEESPSVKSQNGRGSRMAWVSKTKLLIRETRRSPQPRPSSADERVVTSIREEKNDEVVVRPASWDSKDDPLETTNTESANPHLDFISDFSTKQNEKVVEPLRPLRSSKAKTYVKVIDTASRTSSRESGLNKGLSSSSDSETESTKEFFTKSIPRRPQQRRRDSESFRGSENNTFSRISRRVVVKASNPSYKSTLSHAFCPVKSWFANSPFEEELVEDWQDLFPLSWFRYLLKRFGILKINQSKSSEPDHTITVQNEKLLDQLLSDEFIEECYR